MLWHCLSVCLWTISCPDNNSTKSVPRFDKFGQCIAHNSSMSLQKFRVSGQDNRVAILENFVRTITQPQVCLGSPNVVSAQPLTQLCPLSKFRFRDLRSRSHQKILSDNYPTTIYIGRIMPCPADLLFSLFGFIKIKTSLVVTWDLISKLEMLYLLMYTVIQ